MLRLLSARQTVQTNDASLGRPQTTWPPVPGPAHGMRGKLLRMQHFLNFLPLPQGQSSSRPIIGTFSSSCSPLAPPQVVGVRGGSPVSPFRWSCGLVGPFASRLFHGLLPLLDLLLFLLVGVVERLQD